MDISAALPTFVITLREGVEATLVVGIVMAYLHQAQQTRLNRWVYGGIGLGLLSSVLVGVVLMGTLRSLSSSSQPDAPVLKEFLEAGFGLVAIALLSWMLVWMTQQARAMKGEIEGSLSAALTQAEATGQSAGWSVLGLILIAVLREGFETVIFMAAQVQAGWLPILGAIAGLIGAVVIGILLFRVGIRINLKRFFQVMGILLLLIVAGLVVSALRHFDGAISLLANLNPSVAHWCYSSSDACLLGPQVWDTSNILPDRQFPGILLKAFFGYTQHLYLVQALAYGFFWLTIGNLYLKSLTGWTVGKPPEKPSMPQSPSAAD